MRVLETIAETRSALAESPRPLGLVPTMGYLHEGHLSLVRQARSENRSVAVSIFVNPTQFGPSEDYAAYPRDLDRDLGLLQQEGVDFVFGPSVQEMYPEGFASNVLIERITDRLEGAARPTHFKGVATVVTKLFNIVQPDRAYFGQKDAQQLQVIRKMVTDLNVPIGIRAVPTMREPDGLAMSSRNVLLTPEQRAAAPVLSRALCAAEQRYRAGERSGDVLRSTMSDLLAAEPLARADYVSVAAADTLKELKQVDQPALLSLAVRFGKVRLIDNIPLP